jgi:hypothetical protein
METWDTVKIQAFRLQEWPEGQEAHCKYLITFGPEAWRQNLWHFSRVTPCTPHLVHFVTQQQLILSTSQIVRIQHNRRRVCRKTPISDPPSPAPPRRSKTILDTPRRTRLIADAKATAGNLPRTQLFKIHNVANRTGYRILKEGTPRRSSRIHNRG